MQRTKHAFPLVDDPDYIHEVSLDLVPADVSHLASAPSSEVKTSRIDLKWHPQSQHAAIEGFQPPSYYEDYLMTATYSAKMQEHQESQARKLVSLHDGQHGVRSFLEVGCGDGSFLEHVRPQVPRVVGIEASRRFADEAIRRGFEAIVGYVSSVTPLTSEKFDSFASRQVFEHLPDPLDVLLGIREMLEPNAIGLIEVPNGRRALRLRRFYEFFPDHVNYYSVNSLVALASDAGLNVVACNEAFGGDYLELWVRYDHDVSGSFRDLASHRENICQCLAQEIKRVDDSGGRVAIWGAGAKTLTILAACQPELCQAIVCVIDSDPHKHGRYIPNTSIPVVTPAQGAEAAPRTVFILALSYRDEIAQTIRQQIPACQAIFTLDDFGGIIKL